MVGMDIYLDLKIQNKAIRCKSRIVGWHKEQFFILEGPRVNGKDLPSKPGEAMVVRFMLDGTIYGFNATLVRKILLPIQMWLMSYPNIVETKTLRQDERLSMLIPASIHGQEKNKALILDLSKGGALVEVNQKFELGSKLKISFSLPNNDKVDDMEVEVRGFSTNQNGFQIGTSFDGANQEHRQKINSFIGEIKNNTGLVVATETPEA